MRRAAIIFGAALTLFTASACADVAPDKRMRSEDKLVLAALVVGSVAVTAVGAFVHWKLLKPPSKPGE
jgi:hypothetical protein